MDPITTPQRTQYLFDLSGVKYKSRDDIFKMQQQWNTFERVENYNDIIYQRFTVGLRDKLYYQFKNREEINFYKNGQELHILRYPWLPATTFYSISERTMPDVAVIRGPPNYSQTPRGIIVSTCISSSELTENLADLSVYTHVSSYNAIHEYKYIFVSNEEKIAYHKAERRVLFSG